MAAGPTPHFQNDAGHARIEIGVKEFMCVGSNPPYDHPHIFLELDDSGQKVCPYCSTLYVSNSALHGSETLPSGCVFDPKQSSI